MADDLDKTVLEAADNYTKTAPPQKTIDLPKLPPTIQRPSSRPQEGAFTRLMHGAGLPASFKEVKPYAESFSSSMDPFHFDAPAGTPISQRINLPALGGPVGVMGWNILHTIGSEMGQQSGQGIDAAQHNELGSAIKHAIGAGIPLAGPPAAEGNYAGAAGRIASLVAPILPKLIKGAIPEQFKFDLIDKGFGEGAIEPKYGKDFGRGLSRAKQGPLTRGQAAQPSAGVYKETGLTKGATAGLDEATTAKNNILQHPAGQTKTIDGIKLIEDNFGPIVNNPITGIPEVQTVAPTNVPEGTVTQFNQFGNRLLTEVIKRGGKLSAADIEQMRKSGVIDPNYGSFSTEAPDLALNQKAGRVSSAMIKAAEDAVRLPNGQSALELVNSHLADLMQGKKALPEKLAAGRMEAPNTLNILNAINPMSYLRKAVAETVKPAPGFNAGAIGMPIRTGLASALTEKPWWLTNPTRGLPMPNAAPNVPNAAPPKTGLSSIGSGGGNGSSPTNPVQSNFPAQPIHIEEGQRVTGSDVNGTPVSGDVKKIYAVVDKNSGTPQWKALVLDNSKGKVVEIPAEQAIPTENQITTLTKQAGEAQAKAVPRTKTRPQEIVEALRKDMESHGPVTVPSSSPIREIQDRGFKRYNPGVPDLETVAPQTKTGPSTSTVTKPTVVNNAPPPIESPFKQGDIVKFNHGGEIYKGKVSSEVQQSKKGPYVIVNRWPAPYTGQYNVLVKDLKN